MMRRRFLVGDRVILWRRLELRLSLAPYLQQARRAIRRAMRAQGYSDEMIARVFVVNLQDDILVGVPASMLDMAFVIVEEIVWAAGHD